MASKPIIVNAIGSVIDSMRDTGIIFSFVENTPGNYTLTTSNNLSDNDVIIIDNVDYLISNVTSSLINISGAAGLDFNNKTWKAKAPYYLFGHPKEIVNILAERSKSGTWQYQKFPLIALFQDFEESIITGSSEASLNIIIANRTKAEYRAADRYANNFEPILYPLLEQFERALKFNKFIDQASFEYSKTDRLYWGNEGLYGNEGNIFNDYIDAIEITDLSLKFKNIC